MTPGRGLCVLVCLLALVALAGAGGAAAVTSPSDVSVSELSYAGNGTVPAEVDGELAVWRDDQHAFEVDVVVGAPGTYRVCLVTAPPDENATARLGCRDAELYTDQSRMLTLRVDAWPANATGHQTVTARVTAESADGTLDDAETRLAVLDRSGDFDDDELTNAREVELGTAITEADTDGDGLVDAAELNVHGTDPTKADTDDDGLSDTIEVHTYGSNPSETDTDDDGLSDGAEVNEYGTDPTDPDTDADGLADGAEVEEYGTNPAEADTDGDGLSDGAEVNVHDTDPTEPDTDDDGLPDGAEVEEYGTNPTKADTDEDGLSDGAEVNVHGTDPTEPDTDDDGRDDAAELTAGTDPARDENETAGGGDASRLVWGVPQTWTVAGGVFAVTVAAVLAAALLPGVRSRVRTRLGALRDRSGRQSDGDGTAPASDEPSRPDPATAEGYTDEERVIVLLEDHDGRLPQSRVVEELDWSKAKVSRVLSRMDEADLVTKIQLGRRNLITLPGEEPQRSSQPFDDPGRD